MAEACHSTVQLSISVHATWLNCLTWLWCWPMNGSYIIIIIYFLSKTLWDISDPGLHSHGTPAYSIDLYTWYSRYFLFLSTFYFVIAKIHKTLKQYQWNTCDHPDVVNEVTVSCFKNNNLHWFSGMRKQISAKTKQSFLRPLRLNIRVESHSKNKPDICQVLRQASYPVRKIIRMMIRKKISSLNAT